MITGSELLEAVADQIEKNPDCYDQTSWGYVTGDNLVAHPGVDVFEQMGLDSCGTRGCIAGWAVALNMKDPDTRDRVLYKLCGIGDVAAGLFGFDDHTADILFSDRWGPYNSTVPEALRLLAKGHSITEVTHPDTFVIE